ncbi:Collagen alpha-3(VI) chain, partial [Paramuricea clavata]
QKACASNPCENGGTCTDVGTDTFECTCQEGFEGPTCADVVCVHPEIDMIYVMDGSGSVGKKNFENMKDFIQELNERFTIGTNDVRVAIQEYSYSDHYVYAVQLGEGNINGNIDDLNGVVSNMPYLNGGTYTGEALKRARTVVSLKRI